MNVIGKSVKTEVSHIADMVLQIDGGPNPADEDLIPAKGNITFLSGKSIFIYNLTVLDDQVRE